MNKRVMYLTLAGFIVVLLGLAMPIAGPAYADFSVTTTEALNVRSQPTSDSAVISMLSAGDVVTVSETVGGEEILGNNASWFHLASGGYIYSAYTRGGDGTTYVGQVQSSRYVEVDRSALVARAIENGQVVYTAPVTVGTAQFPTPIGQFSVIRRVANESMDSLTIGIPRESPDGYFLDGVLYTQYFTNNGDALHYNYWSPRDAFGNYPTSHGCVGMELADASFFWDFATIGTPVIITR